MDTLLFRIRASTVYKVGQKFKVCFLQFESAASALPPALSTFNLQPLHPSTPISSFFPSSPFAMSTPVAAVANRGNTLFIWYTTSPNTLGALFAVSTKPKSDDGNNTNTLMAQPQFTNFKDPNPIDPSRIITSASMVSSAARNLASGVPGTQLHHLYLAINTPVRPYLIRLAPVSPNIGDGQSLNNSLNARSWDIIDQSKTLNITPNTSLWLASAKALVVPTEGSAIYELFTRPSTSSEQSWVYIQKLDVSDQPLGTPEPGWSPTFRAVNYVFPKIVRLSDDPSRPFYGGFIIGGCQTNQNSTCMSLLSGDSSPAIVRCSDPQFHSNLPLVSPQSSF